MKSLKESLFDDDLMSKELQSNFCEKYKLHQLSCLLGEDFRDLDNDAIISLVDNVFKKNKLKGLPQESMKDLVWNYFDNDFENNEKFWGDFLKIISMIEYNPYGWVPVFGYRSGIVLYLPEELYNDVKKYLYSNIQMRFEKLPESRIRFKLTKSMGSSKKYISFSAVFEEK